MLAKIKGKWGMWLSVTDDIVVYVVIEREVCINKKPR